MRPRGQGGLRVIYQNAWKWNYGPFMQDIHEGMAYDIPVRQGRPASVADISGSAADITVYPNPFCRNAPHHSGCRRRLHILPSLPQGACAAQFQARLTAGETSPAAPDTIRSSISSQSPMPTDHRLPYAAHTPLIRRPPPSLSISPESAYQDSGCFITPLIKRQAISHHLSCHRHPDIRFHQIAPHVIVRQLMVDQIT